MAHSRSLVTSFFLLCVVPALACNPKDEGAASDSATDTTGTPDTTTTGDTAPTASTPTTGDTGTSGDDTEGLSSGDTDPTATSERPTTSAGSFTTDTTDTTDTNTPETDTGADACPEPDPSLAGVSVSPWESAPSADCSVMSASNAGGKVSLDLLCKMQEVAVDLTVPMDFKVDLEGLTDVKLFVANDVLFEGISFVIHDLATGDLVLAAHQMNGLLNYPQLAPLSLAVTASCGDSPCTDTSEITFSHADGPSLALFPGSRGTLSSGGRDHDIILRSAWEDLCREHVGAFTWIVGASASK
jgi:hypothetical protein